MALEPCPACARPISHQARFCVHCHAPIMRAAGADINCASLKKAISPIRNTAHTLRERSPSTRLCLLVLLIGYFLVSFSGLAFFADSGEHLALGILMFALLNFPALLAFVLILLRRPFGLYGALAVFVFSLWWSAGLAYIAPGHRPIWMVGLASVSAWGVVVSFLEAAGGKVPARVVAFVAFFLLQLTPLVLVLLFSSS